MSKSRPILFSDEMVRAILEGRKTQTRRVSDLEIYEERYLNGRAFEISYKMPTSSGNMGGGEAATRKYFAEKFCKYGTVGDRLWVREAWAKVPFTCTWNELPYKRSPDGEWNAFYRTGFDRSAPSSWKPSIHMPRWASRITLEVTGVRVERLQDISDEDANAEGFEGTFEHSQGCDYEDCALAGGVEDCDGELSTAVDNFQTYWDSFNAKNPSHSWAANPWVWAISFKDEQGD